MVRLSVVTELNIVLVYILLTITSSQKWYFASCLFSHLLGLGDFDLFLTEEVEEVCAGCNVVGLFWLRLRPGPCPVLAPRGCLEGEAEEPPLVTLRVAEEVMVMGRGAR